jgi:hypothetical protein
MAEYAAPITTLRDAYGGYRADAARITRDSEKAAAQRSAPGLGNEKRPWISVSTEYRVIADLSSETIVNFGMARHRSLRARRRVGEDRMTTTFSRKSASVPAEVVQQFVPFHFGAVPREPIAAPTRSNQPRDCARPPTVQGAASRPRAAPERGLREHLQSSGARPAGRSLASLHRENRAPPPRPFRPATGPSGFPGLLASRTRSRPSE